ncbi:hypothetical protein KAR91_74005 [Candidatus Pacearchaeota archaeon]|nr:hypothetical protein [Candidatus Pacearchaeota archaeon]
MGKRVSLLEHEVHCDNCKGTGRKKFNRHNICPKCNGAGAIDWIDNIIGRKRSRKSKVKFWSTKTPVVMHTLFDPDIVDELVKQLAEKINKDIIKTIIQDRQNAAI